MAATADGMKKTRVEFEVYIDLVYFFEKLPNFLKFVPIRKIVKIVPYTFRGTFQERSVISEVI